MGDHPSRRPRNGTELTDQIFTAPLKFVIFTIELTYSLYYVVGSTPR